MEYKVEGEVEVDRNRSTQEEAVTFTESVCFPLRHPYASFFLSFFLENIAFDYQFDYFKLFSLLFLQPKKKKRKRLIRPGLSLPVCLLYF